MARLMMSGFETGAATEWESTTGTIDIQTTRKRSGDYALKVTATGGRQALRWDFNSIPNAINRDYIYIEEYPSSEATILAYNTGSSGATGNYRDRITLGSDGRLRLYNESNVAIGSASAVLSLNQWYRIDLAHLNISGSGDLDGTVGKIDGTTFAEQMYPAGTYGNVRGIVVGYLDTTTQTSGIWYFDDIAVNDENGSSESAYPADGSVILLMPDGVDSDSGGWALGAGSSKTQAVNTIPPDADSGYVSSNTLNATIDYTLEASPSDVGTVNMVQGIVRYRGDTTSGAQFRVGVRASSGGTQEVTGQISANTTSYQYNVNDAQVPIILYDLPGASTTAWTKTDLDAAIIGLILSTTGTTNARVTFLGLMVEYQPTTGGGSATITPAPIDATPTVLAPTPTSTSARTIAAIDASPDLPAPTATATAARTLGTVDAAPDIPTPTTATSAARSLTPIDASPDLPSPTTATTLARSIDPIDASPTVLAPTVSTGPAITIDPIDATPDVQAPTMATHVARSIAAIDATPTAQAPTTTSRVTRSLTPVEASPQIATPTVTTTPTVAPAPIDASPTVLAPTISVTAITIAIAPIDATPTVLAPAVGEGNTFIERAHAEDRAAYTARPTNRATRSIGLTPTTVRSSAENRATRSSATADRRTVAYTGIDD